MRLIHKSTHYLNNTNMKYKKNEAYKNGNCIIVMVTVNGIIIYNNHKLRRMKMNMI